MNGKLHSQRHNQDKNTKGFDIKDINQMLFNGPFHADFKLYSRKALEIKKANI